MQPPGPFPQFPSSIQTVLSRFKTRREFYLHFAYSASAESQYPSLQTSLCASCPGCAEALVDHTPTYGGSLALQTPLAIQTSQRRILLALHRSLSIEYAPQLASITHLLLWSLTEREAYAVAWTLVTRSIEGLKQRWRRPFYLCTDSASHQIFIQTFSRLSPNAARRGDVLDALLVDALPLRLQMTLLDHVVASGAKALYRFALALVDRFPDAPLSQLADLVDAADKVPLPSTIMCGLPSKTRVDFCLLKRRRLSRALLRRLDEQALVAFVAPPRPPPHISASALAKSRLTFSLFARWVDWLDPVSQLSCAVKLERRFGSDADGFSLEAVYRRAKDDAAHLLALGLDGGCIVGLYLPPGALVATKYRGFTGDATLFLVRLDPEPAIFRTNAEATGPLVACRQDALCLGLEPALFVDEHLKLGQVRKCAWLEDQGDWLPASVHHDLSDSNARYFNIEWVELFSL